MKNSNENAIINKLTEDTNKQYLNVKLYSAIYKDKNIYFTNERIRIPDLVNRGIYKYEIKEYCGHPCEISDHVSEDFFGTIISIDPIEYNNEEEFEIEIWFKRESITVLDLILDVYRKDLHQSKKFNRE